MTLAELFTKYNMTTPIPDDKGEIHISHPNQMTRELYKLSDYRVARIYDWNIYALVKK